MSILQHLAFITLIMLITAAVLDMKYQIIPNALTFSCMGVGIIALFVWAVLNNSWKEFITACAVMIILFIFGMFGLLGLGDIKLLMAVNILSGPISMIFTVGIGSLMVIVVNLIGSPQEAVTSVKQGLMAIYLKNLNIAKNGGIRVPFAPYLLVGFILGKVITHLWLGKIWI